MLRGRNVAGVRNRDHDAPLKLEYLDVAPRPSMPGSSRDGERVHGGDAIHGGDARAEEQPIEVETQSMRNWEICQNVIDNSFDAGRERSERIAADPGMDVDLVENEREDGDAFWPHCNITPPAG